MTSQYSVQLNGHTPLEGLRIKCRYYALSRRVSGCPSTKFGTRIALNTQALKATVNITLDLLLVHVGQTPRQFNHVSSLVSHTYVLFEDFSTSSGIEMNPNEIRQ
jgi:hypothetical protein